MKNLFTKKTIRGVPKNKEDLTPVTNGYHMFGQNILYQYPQKIFLDDKYLQTVDERYPILAYTSSVGEIGIIKESFYRSGDNGAFQGLFPKKHKFTFRELQFILISIKKQFDLFGYATGMANVLELKFQLPTKNREIDYDFMENFIAELEARHIAELEAYLSVTGLDGYTLTEKEENALKNLSCNTIDWGEFTYQDIFNNIEQGRRLKKVDQNSGNIPFVMSGVTNNGVVAYIDNPVASFPKNSITVDIFGNAFYRNYQFGAGDDTGVYWNDKIDYSYKTMLFFTTAIEKSIRGKYSYGKKLRSSQSLQFKMKLPKKGESPDYEYMILLISAIQKMVIKDVVLYSNQKIKATKDVVS